uniref:AlNc14C151G7526 protein n=1 Tax=Albugo laibachii Nc14 TaxID=890382 RepID=F0WM15_9STRA|nr:AlNc14C151G7526 [Albugo laibachii Nc14]|eukprot:CCA22342.1 AlNc14C151G7526 [Albugo laibachii Nc14]
MTSKADEWETKLGGDKLVGRAVSLAMNLIFSLVFSNKQGTFREPKEAGEAGSRQHSHRRIHGVMRSIRPAIEHDVKRISDLCHDSSTDARGHVLHVELQGSGVYRREAKDGAREWVVDFAQWGALVDEAVGAEFRITAPREVIKLAFFSLVLGHESGMLCVEMLSERMLHAIGHSSNTSNIIFLAIKVPYTISRLVLIDVLRSYQQCRVQVRPSAHFTEHYLLLQQGVQHKSAYKEAFKSLLVLPILPGDGVVVSPSRPVIISLPQFTQIKCKAELSVSAAQSTCEFKLTRFNI